MRYHKFLFSIQDAVTVTKTVSTTITITVATASVAFHVILCKRHMFPLFQGACGTGMITKYVAPRCKELIATDFSTGMLKQAKKNCKDFQNVKLRKANIMELKCKDEAFDKVIAGNVIHLLDEPYEALAELYRVCKKGGQIIIPTYINNENKGKPSFLVTALEKFGAGFKCQFDLENYKLFFEKAGYTDVNYKVVSGKMPCAIAIIIKE